jgi:hypothetical protein
MREIQAGIAPSTPHAGIPWDPHESSARYVPRTSVKLVNQKQNVSSYYWRLATEGLPLLRQLRNRRVPLVVRRFFSVDAGCIRGLDVFTLELRRGNGRDEVPPGPYD